MQIEERAGALYPIRNADYEECIGYYTEAQLKVDEFNAYVKGALDQKQIGIDKACKCYCDLMCETGMCGMCYVKHDGLGQIKETFRYDGCDALKLIRKAMEE